MFSPQTKRIIGHIRCKYGAEPEFLWPEQSPDACVFRHTHNRKWFGIIMVVPGAKLGLKTDEKVCIIDLKFDKNQALDFAENTPGIYPGYHMNKMNWITIVLDESVDDGIVFELARKSYLLTG